MPSKFAKPMLCKLVVEPFDREGWLFEIKLDGYRAIAETGNKNPRLYSRNDLDFSKRFAPITETLKKIKHTAVLDGEIIALKDGKPDFHTLQNYDENQAPLQYAVFDLLDLDGKDLRKKTLRERRELLKKILPKTDKRVFFSDGVENKGKAFFKKVVEQGFEGVVAKDLESTYQEGRRGNDWLKIKGWQAEEAVIVGFTEPRGSRKFLGALVLAVKEDQDYKYIGHSGGGFTFKEIKTLHEKLWKIKTSVSVLKEKVPINSPITWVEPKYVCQVKFSEWTPDGRMRHPIYAGLREDKRASEVREEKPALLVEQNFTHLDKVFWSKDGYTKGDVIEYYKKVAPYILPYLKDRPQSLNRHPNGIEGKNFYQKDVKNINLPEFVRTERIWSSSNKAEIKYLLCQNVETLLYLANLGCIEINSWSSRVENLDRPDYMILDLDPGKNKFDLLIKVAEVAHELLEKACEVHYIKTSGKKGLHILVPLGGKYDYASIRIFSELLMQIVHRKLPEITSLERHPAKRGGKIYLDYLQNSRGQTIAAPYSMRPWPGATVSTPLKWSEVKKGLDPKKFNIKTIHARLKKYGDLWQGLLEESVDLAESIKCLEGEMKSNSKVLKRGPKNKRG